MRRQPRHRHRLAAARALYLRFRIILIARDMLRAMRTRKLDLAHAAEPAGCVPVAGGFTSRGLRGYKTRYATAITPATAMPKPAC